MRDIPVFTTENGVASLFLKEISYKKTAYIRIQDSVSPEELLKECVEFCVSAGAEAVYATGHACLEAYPVHTVVMRMSRSMEYLPQTDAALFPVQDKTIAYWRKIYNERMSGVAGAATITAFDEKRVLSEGGAYFVHRGERLLGIGKVSPGQIGAVVAVEHGAGEAVVLSLCSALNDDEVTLEVAQNNLPAVRLYRRLGFTATTELCRWYQVK